MSTLLELPTATIEWALLSPLIVLLGVGCVGNGMRVLLGSVAHHRTIRCLE